MDLANNLATSLAKAQSEMKAAPKNGYNPHFKNSFSTLEDLIEASRAALTRNHLAVTQYPDSTNDELYLVTKLKHASGQEEVSRVRIFLKDNTDIQKLGSAMSYLKRYAYAAICGIATSEGDDDGNQVSQGARESEIKSDYINSKQLFLLRTKLGNNADIERQICTRYQIGSLDKLPWKKMNELVDLLDKNLSKSE